MSLLYPGWLTLLLLLPLMLLGAILSHRGRNKAWHLMVAPRLRKQLVVEGSSTRRWIALILALIGCALTILVVARPYHGQTTVTEQIRSRNILIAIDTSRSMLVQDTSPNRIGSAKIMALELTGAFPDDRIGIMAFSGAPIMMAPLTIDHSAVEDTIKQLDTNVIPSGGSDLPLAVELAIKTFKKSGHKSNALIIISDGEDHSQKVQLAGSEIRDAGIAVCTIGVGNTQGGIIPDPRSRDGKFLDSSGRTVHSRLNPDSLSQLARAGGGSYVAASSGADNAIRQALTFLESDQQSGREASIPLESYHWFLFPAIILFIISMVIRSSLFSSRIAPPKSALWLAAILLVNNQPLQATTEIDQARDAYLRQDYKTALNLFGKALPHAKGEELHAIEFSQGSSAYKINEWDIASRYFSRSLLTTNEQLREESHYNLGNALFQSGWAIMNPAKPNEEENPFLKPMRELFSKKNQQQPNPDKPSLTPADVERVTTYWQDALDHYREALNINTQNNNAEHNREEVEKLLQQLQDARQQAKKESEEQNKNQPKQGEGEKSDQEKEGEGEGGQPKKDSDQDGEGDSKNKPDGKNSDDSQQQEPTGEPDDDLNQTQAMEQRPDESKEAFAARILKEQSDAETRPVTRRFLRLRRPEKDW